MIVNRRTFMPKRGRLEEAAEWLRKEGAKMGMLDFLRISVPEIAPLDILVVETEFENWEQYHKFWAEWSPGDEFWAKWYSLTENGGTNEVWRLVE